MSGTLCDICREEVMGRGAHYALQRHDFGGYCDTMDLCSAECLASAAVGEGHERGDRDACARMPLPDALRRRRWWQR